MKLFASRRAKRTELRAADGQCRNWCGRDTGSPDELLCPPCRDDLTPMTQVSKQRNGGPR